MSDTYGLFSPSSSASVSFQRSLESKLRQRFDLAGSIEYFLIWKGIGTPAQRHVCRLRASGRRTSDKGCSGWPTVTTEDHKCDGPKTEQEYLNAIAEGRPVRQSAQRLRNTMLLTGWPTSVAQQANGTPEAFLRRKRESVARGNSMGICLSDLNMVAQMVGWPTPKEQNARGPSIKHDGLWDVANLAGWGTPMARDYRTPNSKAFADRGGGKKGEQLPNQVAHSGPTPEQSSAGTGKPAAYPQENLRLNAFFSFYLMGYPVSYVLSMARALLERKKG